MTKFLTALVPFLPLLLGIAGLSFLVAAAYAVAVVAGLVATGVACLLLGWAFEANSR